MVRFYNDELCMVLKDKKKKYIFILGAVSFLVLVLFITLFLFVNRDNKLIMKFILSFIIIIGLYLDSYLLLGLIKDINKEINHYNELSRYDEVIYNGCLISKCDEIYTRNKIGKALNESNKFSINFI